MDWKINPAKKGLRGEITVPPDKSISHRAVMFGSISKGKSRVNNFLSSEDCLRTLEAFQSMSIHIDKKEGGLMIEGKGLKGLTPPSKDLYMGNSGTAMRIIAGILAGQNFKTCLTGDKSLSSRPMERIINPLRYMGAEIESIDGHPPLTIKGTQKALDPIKYVTPIASAQVKSCVLSAGLYADGETFVTEPFTSRDHTEKMLAHFSADITKTEDNLTTRIKGMKELTARDVNIPGDISSAAFFIVAALIVKNSDIILRKVGINPTRTGIITVLKRMGAKIDLENIRDKESEPVADIRVSQSPLKGTVIEEREIPTIIDEVPVLIIAALTAEGRTEIRGISELKVKESDRIKSMTDNLKKMGISVFEENNVLFIEGKERIFKAAELDSFGDHRIAMVMAVASLLSDGECTVKDTENVSTSYPGFSEHLKRLVNRNKNRK